ncbi:mannosyltransferase [Gramella sp. AN32]|uniref:Mannosyltransferase n=1 Tax=Christiangramia antarctica TaxID=2058158 RepID=A0ABW5X9S5_9FLAO|nr:mannosyltransferase [Gramella sp. AN32]MCM4155542.1 mannosyltransferase [Gramella sp. AN32]
MDLKKLQLYKTPLVFTISCFAFYLSFAYDLERPDFIKLAGLYLGLFFLSFKLIQMQKHNFWFLAGAALLFRLVFMFALPNLSQDYFRFIWDGRLIASGMNPYQFIPDNIIGSSNLVIAQASELIKGMGSLNAGNYSNYAPLNQLIFAVAGFLSAKSILGSAIIFRIVIILADFGTLFFGRKLLKSFGLPEHRIFWYILNPFIIIEMTGNLHFESVMVFLLIWSLYLLHQRKWIFSAIVFGLSISVKLLPLLFLPLLLKYFLRASTPLSMTTEKNSKGNATKTGHPGRLPARGTGSRRIDGFLKLIAFYFLVLATVVLSFLPFYSAEVFLNFMSSVGLWFGKFEFNASVYYIIRWIGFQWKGYNIIESAGTALAISTFLLVIIITFLRQYQTTKQLITNMLFAVTIYLIFSTTVHPWYLAIPLILSVFTEFKYVIVWSGAIILSYYAYSHSEFQENLWLIGLEYLLVAGYFLKEFFRKIY